MRTNYILIDFESVQPKSLEPLTHDHFKVIVFVGASQTKLSFEIAESMQQLGSRAQYIRISGKGSNALDFHIAYYIGLLAAAEPSAYFHIISKDTGFDPLIQHLRSKEIVARRVQSIGEVLKTSNAKSLQEQIAIVIDRLQRLNHAKPRTIKTLSSTIASLFQNQLSEQEVAALIQSLASKGHLEISSEKVSYAKK